ncbi:hypothetical protein BRAS3843_980003 [Bradyrhizobium sp. STM 3843]|nr:hypothetical protein BRAS3843_980003 [Bradyrhizobium sp. STM 3843]
MAGFGPAIHVARPVIHVGRLGKRDVDARVKPGHDEHPNASRRESLLSSDAFALPYPTFT